MEYQAPLTIQQIQQLIPHRSPFLLIDRVLDFTIGEKIVAIKNISMTDPYLEGHFPDNPVMPGVLIIEGLAQTSAVLGRLTDPTSSSVLLTEISSARFRRQVTPGDTLTLEVTVVKHRKPFYWFAGVAKVGSEVAAEVSFSARLA